MPQDQDIAELARLIELALLKADELEELHIGALLSDCLALIHERLPNGS